MANPDRKKLQRKKAAKRHQREARSNRKGDQPSTKTKTNGVKKK